MPIGFLDLSQTRRVPDRDFIKNEKPIYHLADYGEGYESRISLGTNSFIESYSLKFSNRTIEEISALTSFFSERGKYKNFEFTVPDTEEPSGEKTIIVYCEGYSQTYINDKIGSLNTTFTRVYEEDTGTAIVNILTKNLVLNEGVSQLISISTINRGPEVLYWTIDGATTQDFISVNGSFTTLGNSQNASGSFTIEVVADVTTEGTEEYTLTIREGSISGTELDVTNLSILDTSVGAEVFNWRDSQGANLITQTLASGRTTTVYIGVSNFDPDTPLYFSVDPIEQSALLVNPYFGTVNLTGTFADSESFKQFTSIFEVANPTPQTVNLRKDSVTGEIVDYFTLNIVPETFIGGRITNSQGQDIDFVVLEAGSPFTTTLYYTANFFDVQNIYWTIENAVGGGVDFDFVSGSFLPTGTTENNTATFNIIKQSGTFPEVYTIYLRTGSASGPIIDVCTLIYADVYLTASEEVSSSHALYNLNFSTTEVTKRFNRIPGIITTDSASSSIGLFNVSFNPKLDSTNIERKGQILFTAIDSATSEVALDNLNFSTAEVTKRFDKIEGIVTTDTSSGRGGINNLSFSGIATLNRI